jgi:hypothetical protein
VFADYSSYCRLYEQVLLFRLTFFLLVHIKEAAMARRQTPRVEVLGADFAKHGLAVAQDWRYDLVCDYLKLSPSYQAVRSHKRGEQVELPADNVQVEQVYADFGDLYKIREADWWGKIGRQLYGITAPLPQVQRLGSLDAMKTAIRANWQGIDSVVVEIPLALTLPQALRQVRKAIEKEAFAAALPAQVAPKYQLAKSKLRIETLTAGVDALKLYKRGMPLWQIGNHLRVVPAQCFDDSKAFESHKQLFSENKEILSIAARRLIRTAVLVAENAARGRFPSDRPFAEAMMGDYRRKAGRPVGSTSPKRRKAGA